MKTRCNDCRKLIDYGNSLCDECKPKRIKLNKKGLKDKQAEKMIKSNRWKKVRAEVLRRDKCCVLCLKNKYIEYRGLQVHHIIKRTDDMSLAYEPNNLVTVCRKCHEQLELLPPTKQRELLDYKPTELEFYL